MRYDAGRDAAVRYPGWRITRRPLDGTCFGFTVHRRRLIVIDSGLSKAQWNSTVCHELVHLDRGDRCTLGNAVIDERRERAVNIESARRQVCREDVLRLWHFGMHPDELAAGLGVDRETLAWWREGLEDEDLDYINGRLLAREEGAA